MLANAMRVPRSRNPSTHTRLPRYIRDKVGIVEFDYGVFAFPDTHAHGQGEHPQHCYRVRFTARELWGPTAAERDTLRVDVFNVRGSGLTVVSDANSSPLLSRALPNFDDANLIFAEPWEARAFAIIVNLAQAGHFTWGEWVDCFSQEVARATAAEASGAPVKTYYEQWLDAAETLVVAKGLPRARNCSKRFAIGAVGPAHVIT